MRFLGDRSLRCFRESKFTINHRPMKQITLGCLIALMMAAATAVKAQQTAGGAFTHNPDELPCLTQADYDYYNDVVTQNTALLEAQGLRAYQPGLSSEIIAFDWPVAQASGFEYNSTWAISNYVDHDDTTGALEDWNCGVRTYDTSSGYDHKGLDIYLWPFTWTQVDQEQTEVVAAASGQIVFKNDGAFDMNCDFNSQQWNAVYVEHSDGSMAWYGHMKNGSLTPKNVGDMVTAGEKLGIVASSGNSTGPHLHFEVYDVNGDLIDPYVGPCNPTTTTSWWANQKDYLNTGINAVLTHTDIPDFGSCPAIETTHIANSFQPGDTVWFFGYYRDQRSGTSALCEVITPSGAVFSSWTRDFANDYYSSWWGRSRVLSSEEGTWRFSVSYNGDTVTHEFDVAELSVDESSLLQLSAYPNPTTHSTQITTTLPIANYKIYDLTGKIIAQKTGINNIEATVDLSSVSPGMYFLHAKALDSDQIIGVKLLKE